MFRFTWQYIKKHMNLFKNCISLLLKQAYIKQNMHVWTWKDVFMLCFIIIIVFYTLLINVYKKATTSANILLRIYILQSIDVLVYNMFRQQKKWLIIVLHRCTPAFISSYQVMYFIKIDVCSISNHLLRRYK